MGISYRNLVRTSMYEYVHTYSERQDFPLLKSTNSYIKQRASVLHLINVGRRLHFTWILINIK